MRERPWKGGGRAVRGLVLGGVLLASGLASSGLASPGLAQAQDGGRAFSSGLLSLLRQPQSMAAPDSGIQAFEARHDQICAELERAGLLLLAVAWNARDRVMHVFYDPGSSRYVSVSGPWPTWVRLSDGMPSLQGYSLTAE